KVPNVDRLYPLQPFLDPKIFFGEFQFGALNSEHIQKDRVGQIAFVEEAPASHTEKRSAVFDPIRDFFGASPKHVVPTKIEKLVRSGAFIRAVEPAFEDIFFREKIDGQTFAPKRVVKIFPFEIEDAAAAGFLVNIGKVRHQDGDAGLGDATGGDDF